MKKQLITAVLTVSLAAAFTTVPYAEEEKILTYAQSKSWDSFNMYSTTNTNTDEIVEFFYDRFWDYNADGTVEPRLAESYEINDSFDVYTIHLRQDAYWHDGEQVTAADVVYTYRAGSTSEQNWLRRPSGIVGTDDDSIELSEDSIGVEALDDFTVQITLKQPVDEMTFLYNQKGTFIFPEHLLGSIPDSELNTAEYWDHPVGSGPMVFESQIQGERFELVKNENYYGGTVDFDRLVVRLMDSAAITAALMSGEVDFTRDLVALDASVLESTGLYTVESIPSFSYQNLVLNLSDDIFLDENVRLAFAKAVNRQAIVDDIYLGYAQVINSLYPETHPYFDEKVTEQYDPEEAKRLLSEAGWDPETVVEFQVPQGNTSREQSAILIQQDLEAVGVKTSIVTYDFATVLQNMRDEKFQILLMGAEGSAIPSSYTGTVTYFSHTQDEDILSAIDSGAAVLTFEEKKPFYDQIQELIVERAPILYLYSPNTLAVYSPRITADFSTLNINISKQIWNWTVE